MVSFLVLFKGSVKLFSTYRLDVQEYIFVCNVQRAFCFESFVVFMLFWHMFYDGSLEIRSKLFLLNLLFEVCIYIAV
jgi:hypothetical protein